MCRPRFVVPICIFIELSKYCWVLHIANWLNKLILVNFQLCVHNVDQSMRFPAAQKCFTIMCVDIEFDTFIHNTLITIWSFVVRKKILSINFWQIFSKFRKWSFNESVHTNMRSFSFFNCLFLGIILCNVGFFHQLTPKKNLNFYRLKYQFSLINFFFFLKICDRFGSVFNLL